MYVLYEIETYLMTQFSTIHCHRLMVWAADGSPPKEEEFTVFWNKFSDKTQYDNIISIPKIVEDNAEKYKRRYLAWIYDIGETSIYGKRLIEHLQLRQSFSYWWMTSLVYKPNAFSSPQIADAVKMFAIEDLVRSYSPTIIVLASGNTLLAEVFRLWCKNAGIKFEWINVKKNLYRISPIKTIFRKLPHILSAFLWLIRYLVKRWSFKKIRIDTINSSCSDVIFCSYLLNLIKDDFKKKRLTTSYWSSLHKIIENENLCVTWIHKYIKHAILPSAGQAQKLLKK